MWAWLKDEGNQRVLVMMGGVIAFLWTAGWGVFVYLNPPVPPKAKSGKGKKGATPLPPQKVTRSRLLTWGIPLVVMVLAWLGWSAYVGKQATYHLCMGEFQKNCAPTEWVPCGTNMEAHVKAAHPDMCVYIKPKKLSDVEGNRCGYATYEYLCSTRPQ